MPDAPISTTPTIGLDQWGSGKNPGFVALNTNWKKIDDAIAALQLLLTFKATQSDMTAVQAAVTALQSAILGFLKLDGSAPMTGNLNLGTKKAINVANGTASADAVNLGQLEAAIAAGLGALGTYQHCRAHASVDLTEGQSPRTFEADTNDEITTAGMHSTSSNKDRFVAQQDGYYLFNARMKVSGFGGAGLTWWKNGAEAPESIQPIFLATTGDSTTFVTDVALIKLLAGDYVTLQVYGLSGPDSGKILALSSVSMFLLSANGVGGGDFNANGSVPMTGNLDLGGNKAINAANATTPTGLVTKQQMEAADAILQAEIDGLGGSLTFHAPEVEVATGGGFAVAANGLWQELLASRLDVTLAATTRVVAEAEATAAPDFMGRSDVQLGLKVQKMVAGSPSGAPDYYPGTWVASGLSASNPSQVPVTCKKRVTLLAGDWRFSIVARKLGGQPNSTQINTNSDLPARIGLTYMG